MDLPYKQFNKKVERPKPFAILIDSNQQESNSEIQGKLQATASDQDIYGVWVYSSQSKFKNEYRKHHKKNILCVTHNQTKCKLTLSVGNLGSQKKKFVMTTNKLN